ncbi:MAG: OsmC family protein [Desulfobacterales bacterium]
MKPATSPKPTIVNGVNVDELIGTVESVKKTASIAKFSFRADNTWIDGGHNRTSIRNFYGAGGEDTSRKTPFILDADEPKVLLGTDRGANPVEYVLTALAGCLTTSLIYHAAARGIAIEEVESQLEGDLDLRGFLGISEDVRNGYDNIRVSFKIKADAPEAQLRDLVELAQKRSPVFDIVSHPVPVTVELKGS